MIDEYRGVKVPGDSKLLSEFPWFIIFKSEKNTIKLLTEYECATQIVYSTMLYSPHYCLGENMTSYLKMETVQEKAMCVLWFFVG
jgi:hypothetical protein